MLGLRFFDRKDKIWVGPLGIIAFVVFYMLPNHFNIFEPSYIHLFSFEELIPFIDWTVWIYMSDYLYIAIVFVLLKDKDNMNRIYYSQIILLMVSMFIFFLLPVQYPRPEVEYIGISGELVRILFSADTPGNACPSIHVAMTFLAGFGFLKERKHLFSWFMIWAVLISLSTLTVKQHYLLDIIAGLSMAIIFYVLGRKFIYQRK
jgi:membrane-associated phospholipid phosphatase